jgi:hypothetical protein
MIAFVLFLCHGAFLLSIQEEWKARGLTDTSFRVLLIMLAASVLGLWGLEPKAWEFEAIEVSTRLVSGLAGCAYAYLLYRKTVDRANRWLRRRDPLRHYARQYPGLRRLFKQR